MPVPTPDHPSSWPDLSNRGNWVIAIATLLLARSMDLVRLAFKMVRPRETMRPDWDRSLREIKASISSQGLLIAAQGVAIANLGEQFKSHEDATERIESDLGHLRREFKQHKEEVLDGLAAQESRGNKLDIAIEDLLKDRRKMAGRISDLERLQQDDRNT